MFYGTAFLFTFISQSVRGNGIDTTTLARWHSSTGMIAQLSLGKSRTYSWKKTYAYLPTDRQGMANGCLPVSHFLLIHTNLCFMHSSSFDSYSLIILCIEEWFYLFFFNTSLTAVNLAKTVFFNGDIGKRYFLFFLSIIKKIDSLCFTFWTD